MLTKNKPKKEKNEDKMPGICCSRPKPRSSSKNQKDQSKVTGKSKTKEEGAKIVGTSKQKKRGSITSIIAPQKIHLQVKQPKDNKYANFDPNEMKEASDSILSSKLCF